MTTTAAPTIQITAEQQAVVSVHTFTLFFPDERLTVLEIRGAANQDCARAIAELSIRHRRTINLRGDQIETSLNYAVIDGDCSCGRAASYCSWTCDEEECQPHSRPEPKRNSHLLRNAKEAKP